ncbi:MAG: agmatine deiminase family protein [Bryobacteraceae bacterium]
MAWPHEKTDWPGKFEAIEWVYCEIAKRLARVERVHILVNDEPSEANARASLKRAHVAMETVDFLHCQTDRSWTRDYCPIFVKDYGENTVIADWHFNGWAKYDNWQADDAVPGAIAKRQHIREVQPELGGRRIVLEGGSIDVNGQGKLLTTEECLLSNLQARNPGSLASNWSSSSPATSVSARRFG